MKMTIKHLTLILFLLITIQLNSQDEYEDHNEPLIKFKPAIYYLSLKDFLDSSNKDSGEFIMRYRTSEYIRANGGGEYFIRAQSIKRKILNKDIFAIHRKDSIFLNMKKYKREKGYSLVRKHENITYLRTFQDLNKKSRTNTIMFGAIGMISTSPDPSFMILDEYYDVEKILVKHQVQNELFKKGAYDYGKELNNYSWNIQIALKYWNLLKSLD